jgi:hypothetical protein
MSGWFAPANRPFLLLPGSLLGWHGWRSLRKLLQFSFP